MDTIFALATALGRAGVAVVRVSGPQSFEVAEALITRLPSPGQARLRVVRDAEGQPVDRALILCFDQGRSFTGERVVEFQLHGAPTIVHRTLDLLTQAGGRIAEPGEFTRRALENGTLDLTQVEGLADLLASDTDAQRVQAMRVFSGALSDTVEIWRRDLIRAASLLEATIDFADEDVPEDVTPEVTELTHRALSSLQTEADGYAAAELVRDGFEVAILGPPNAGKSSLINALARREVAIISDTAGTTRDVIEVHLDLDGLSVTLLDTAGLRAAEDEVEAIGIKRAKARAETSDLRVFLQADQEGDLSLYRDGDLVVGSKSDVMTHSGLSVSAVTAEGLDDLLREISVRAAERVTGAGVVTRARQRDAVKRTINDLESVLGVLDLGAGHAEIAAEGLRAAIRSLDALIGHVDVEAILDEVFLSFCLGK